LGYTPHGGLVDKLNVLSVFLVLCALGQAATITALPGGGATGDILVNSIVGPGITVLPGSISLVGADNQQGTFVNGAASVGLANGIVLTSGSAAALNGVNASSPETLSLGGSGTNSWDAPMFLAGDALLTTLAGNATYDANVLSFSFQFGDGSVGGDLYFSFVFVSEEYIDFANSPWNDVFGRHERCVDRRATDQREQYQSCEQSRELHQQCCQYKRVSGRRACDSGGRPDHRSGRAETRARPRYAPDVVPNRGC
jgi:hypothetical protein